MTSKLSNICLDDSTDFEIVFKGSDAIERQGAFYALSSHDHPIANLLQSPKKVSKGKSVKIGLNILKVDSMKKQKIIKNGEQKAMSHK
jgi:hypothetical protein